MRTDGIPPIEWHTTSTSTNASLAAALHHPQHGHCIATTHQTAGRGRLDRRWEQPRDGGIALSLLLRTANRPATAPLIPLIPLIAASAVAHSLRPLWPAPATPPDIAVKWPNDVLIAGRKVCGILCELTPGGAVIVGIGVNTTLTKPQLPTPTATALNLEGVTVQPKQLATTIRDAVLAFTADAATPGGHQRTLAVLRADRATIGQRVRVQLPASEPGAPATYLHGIARNITDGGALTIAPDGGGPEQHLHAGDVTHVRAVAQ